MSRTEYRSLGCEPGTTLCTEKDTVEGIWLGVSKRSGVLRNLSTHLTPGLSRPLSVSFFRSVSCRVQVRVQGKGRSLDFSVIQRGRGRPEQIGVNRLPLETRHFIQ